MADATTFVWGTDSETTYGVVQSKSENESAEIAEERNHIGQVIVQKAYSKGSEVRLNVLIDSTKTLPTPGSTITLDSVNYLVSSCEKTGEGEGFQKAVIVATKKDSADLEELS